MDLFDLSNKIAIITGGNGGIGLGMARGLAKAGASIVVAARNKEKSEAAVTELRGIGARAMFIPVDVENESSCRALIASTVEQFGKVDILVNNAGIALPKTPEDYTTAEWAKVLQANLTSAFMCAQAVY